MVIRKSTYESTRCFTFRQYLYIVENISHIKLWNVWGLSNKEVVVFHSYFGCRYMLYSGN